MVSGNPSEPSLFFLAVALGAVAGIIGNWIVLAIFRLFPDEDRWNYSLLVIGIGLLGIFLLLLSREISYLASLA